MPARPLALCAAAALAALSVLVAPAHATAEQTSPVRHRAASACLSHAVSYNTKADSFIPHPRGTYRASSRCKDINLRIASGGATKVCVRFHPGPDCARKVRVGAKWKVIASNVRNGARFQVVFDGQFHKGRIAY
ncbi:hypothetical protein [Streptomyces sulphureus]|uniref:hypothetical protein n=1 Tax=Streptomyces sulphureus TaxID=47758 RepID=UPI00037D067F|nr:hypothetical protein [Streptomyces sulphureus]